MKKAETEFVAGQQRFVALLDARKIHQKWQKRHVEIQATYWRTLNKLNTVVGLTH